MATVIDPHITLGELITSHPDLARELERRSFDYCCGGGRTLAEVSGELGLDVDVVVAELAEVEATFTTLRAELDPHMAKEERVLFPLIRQLAAGESPSMPGGTIHNPISMLIIEHDQAGELLERLRELTTGFTVPADGCASYAALYAALAEMEHDTHIHVHKENNRLFPMAVDLEAAAQTLVP
jgi:iron-sulfur cluster repair protein YtfE (RIC family)